jgi:phosphoribosylaminoimidazole-succinocarboxamide synthase
VAQIKRKNAVTLPYYLRKMQAPFQFSRQTNYYRGKVRDVYTIADKYMVMIASNRISAFDHILPKPIPYKGAVLNKVAWYFLKATEDIVPNWTIESPLPNVAIGYAAEPVRIEMVIRGYLTGHAWREYKAGRRVLCGITMPEGMKESDKFPEPIITPATKAEEGHDVDISRDDILAQNLVDEADYLQMEDYTRKLFARGTEMAAEQGLILVDTKYEFGKIDGKIVLIDEIHTPDSSRYFYADGYAERQASGEAQKQLSKEFVRQWLIENGFQGLEGQTMPVMPDEFVQEVTDRYIELSEIITGQAFDRTTPEPSDEEIKAKVEAVLAQLN